MKKNKLVNFPFILFCISILFYLFFALYDGVVICADSPSYIDMSISREYFYPMLLAFFRMFSPDHYLMGIVILQSLLSAFCAWKLTIFLQKQFQLNKIITSLIFVIPCLVSLFNRFIAGRASMYSNSILTEGITIPLFLLFFCYIADYMMNHKLPSLIIASLISFLLVSTRKQMYLTLILLFCIIIYVRLKSKLSVNKKKNALFGILSSVCICFLIFLASFLMDHTYNYIVHNEFTGHSSDNRFVMTMILYTSEREYVELLPEDIQSLYLSIYDICDEKGYLMHSSGKGWLSQVSHFGDHYDHIQIDTMWPSIQEYAATHITNEYTGRELATDDITHQMITSLLPVSTGKIIHVLINNFLSGLVTTVAQRNVVLIWYSLIAYLGYLCLLVANIRIHHGFTNTSRFSLLCIFSIIVNVLLVSAVIFCQTRYTIYNMPLFYISGLLLLTDFLKHYSSKPRSI